MASGAAHNWEASKNHRGHQHANNMDWIKKLHTEDHSKTRKTRRRRCGRARPARVGTLIKEWKSRQHWPGPSSEKAQALAARWANLIEASQAQPGITEASSGLRRPSQWRPRSRSRTAMRWRLSLEGVGSAPEKLARISSTVQYLKLLEEGCASFHMRRRHSPPLNGHFLSRLILSKLMSRIDTLPVL